MSRQFALFPATQEERTTPPSRPHVAHNGGNNEWYTPSAYIEIARRVMGGIDLDPASNAIANATVRATRYYTAEQNGLAQPWVGRVWMNPPYAQPLIKQFCAKLRHEFLSGRVSDAVALVNNGTDTAWFHELTEVAAAIVLLRGRIRFYSPTRETKSPLQGQVLIYLSRSPDLSGFAAAVGELGIVFHSSATQKERPNRLTKTPDLLGLLGITTLFPTG